MFPIDRENIRARKYLVPRLYLKSCIDQLKMLHHIRMGSVLFISSAHIQ